MDITILGIESSCDDTSAAVLRNNVLLSNVIASQAVHVKYGGVIPELASRAHQQNIVPVVDTALREAGVAASEIDAIAFTRGPGLVGSLLVGVSFAKGLSIARNIPLVEVNHLQGHILSHFIVLPARLLGQRLGKPGEVLNGFVWRFLFSAALVREKEITFDGAYLEDELFLMEYFCWSEKLAMVEEPVYYYLQNPASVTRRYLPDYMDTFTRFMEQKEALVQRFGLGGEQPLWREKSNWGGLLIALGNEFAASNPAGLGEKRRRVKAICQRPEMAAAIAAIQPQDLGRNKQIVADLVRKGQFMPLSLLYAAKNR